MNGLLDRAALLLAGLGLACQIDGSIGRAETGGLADTTGDAQTTGLDGASASSGEDGSGAVSAGGSGSAAGSGTDGTGSTGHAEGDTGTPHACMPAPEDSACVACRKASCCELLDACLADAPCTCTWMCVADGLHTLEECALSCEDDGTLLTELHDCVAAQCPGECASPFDDGP